jgi:hypothetical protein
MDRSMEMFAACNEAFDHGRLIAIYPEGATHAEAHVQRIKTGAARIALGYEAHAPGRLTVMPVALSFEARKRFRARVRVSFGEPVAVSMYLAVCREEPAKALHTLTTAIQWTMEREVAHVGRIDTAALARAVEELYRSDVERELWAELRLATSMRRSRARLNRLDNRRRQVPNQRRFGNPREPVNRNRPRSRLKDAAEVVLLDLLSHCGTGTHQKPCCNYYRLLQPSLSDNGFVGHVGAPGHVARRSRYGRSLRLVA